MYNKNANELLTEIKNIKSNVENLLKDFNKIVAEENNAALLYDYDKDDFINYNERYNQLKEELDFLERELPEVFSSYLNQLKILENHDCKYEDGFCIICKKDGRA